MRTKPLRTADPCGRCGLGSNCLFCAMHRQQADQPCPSTRRPLAPAHQAARERSIPELLKAEGLSRAFRAAAQKVLPAVVVIKAGPSPVCPRCGRAHESDEDDDGPAADAGQQKSLDILGSGFIVAPTGIVLTNKHVVQGKPKLVVQTADGKQFPVKQVEHRPGT